MILVNTDYIAGKNLEMLGMVTGSTIQSKNFGKDIFFETSSSFCIGTTSENIEVLEEITVLKEYQKRVED